MKLNWLAGLLCVSAFAGSSCSKGLTSLPSYASRPSRIIRVGCISWSVHNLTEKLSDLNQDQRNFLRLNKVRPSIRNTPKRGKNETTWTEKQVSSPAFVLHCIVLCMDYYFYLFIFASLLLENDHMEGKGARVVESHWRKVNKLLSEAALENFQMYKKIYFKTVYWKIFILFCFVLI